MRVLPLAQRGSEVVKKAAGDLSRRKFFEITAVES
jgi:hypothetical protein